MKYRTKLYLASFTVSLVSTLIALVIFSIATEKFAFRGLQSHTLSMAATAASQLNPELVAKAHKTTSINDAAYIELQEEMQKVVKANRRKDVFVSELFTVYQDPKNQNAVLLGVETLSNPNKPNSIYSYSDAQLILKNQGKYFTDSNFVTDQYGVWLSGFAPIFDKEGKLIATLGVDVKASDVQKSLRALIKYALLGLIASSVISIIIAFFLSKKVTRCLDHLCTVVSKIQLGDLDAKAQINTNDEFGNLSLWINSMTKGLKERDRLKTSFSRYVSTSILDKILMSESPLKLEGERRKVTLLFSDIREFTQLAEKFQPEEVVLLLNQYFEIMIEVIFAHNGTLDKFIGDGIMAEFGAPLEDNEQEKHAVQAAVEMQKSLSRLCDKWEKEGKIRIQMGIGIHTGIAVVGNIGSEKRTEYTAIGDTVNVASRLEQATKTLKTPILISESTYLGSKNIFSFIDHGSIPIPGRTKQIKVFSVEFDNE